MEMAAWVRSEAGFIGSNGLFFQFLRLPYTKSGFTCNGGVQQYVPQVLSKYPEQRDPTRHIAPLRPHDLRHTFAFQLAKATGADAYELERRLGHRSQRYIQCYTNPPEHIAATSIEGF